MMSVPEREVPQEVIIAPTKPIYDLVSRAGCASGKSRKLGLFHYTLLTAGNKSMAVTGPCLGAPAAALLAESLIGAGVEKILLLSAFGSLVPDLGIGDLFIPTGGISEEGTSRLYLKGRVPRPDSALIERIRRACSRMGLHPRMGDVWTTDAPSRETPAKIARFRKLGALAVDMEFTALSTVCWIHNVQFAALAVVSDEIFGERPKKGFHQQKFKESLTLSAQALIQG